MLSIDKYAEYKDNKKVQKIIAKKNIEREKRKISLEEKKQERIKKHIEQQSIRFDKQLRRIEKIKLWELDKHVRKIVNKKALKPKRLGDAKKKQQAYREVQKYSKLSRADKYWYVTLADTWKRVFWSNCQWWHYYSKYNYPQLSFDLNNIHPITATTNRLQWDNTWTRRKGWFIKAIGKQAFSELEMMSNNRTLKFQCKDRDRQFYDEMYQKYKKLNEDLLAMIENERS